MTIGQRIQQAERLPINGTIEQMLVVTGLRQALTGFSEAQKDSYRIVEHGDSFLSGKPDTRLMVTLTDEQVLAWAELIRKRSAQNEIGMSEASVLNSILIEADRLIAETQQ